MRCHQIVLGALLLALTASSASAGRIFGDIKMDGKPVPEGLRVRISQPVAEAAEKDAAKGEAKSEAKAEKAPKVAPIDSCATDKFGAYKLNVKTEGKCTLTVLYEKQPVSLEVFSYKDATRYDLILEKKEGKLALRRK
ncbi:MAG TPA: hypothetical protein VFE28_15255 [Candidatus Krumholzibacteria bacterium]|jgi:hypothetical protein|nr:hypothetical protein [Candidatus Krumholzibacteria bacterium]